jgi:hypothetical protein
MDPAYPVIGFTAARRFPVLAQRIASDRLATMSRAMRRRGVIRPRFITGAARGGDAFIGNWLVMHWLEHAGHLVLVPAMRSQVDWWWLRLPPRWQNLVEVEEMPPGTDFAYRNQEIAGRADHLEGFPELPEDQAIMSGSWQTLRMARKAGKSHFYTIVGSTSPTVTASRRALP